MALLYSAYQSTLETKEGKKQWHPRLVKVGESMTSYELGVEISKRSSMTPGDALNVLDTMMDIIQQNLMNSRSVCLDRLGTFTVTCRSTGNGVDMETEVSSKQITDLKVRFTPSYNRNRYNGTTRAMFDGVTFEKINRSKVQKSEDAEETPEPEETPDDGGYLDPNS
jgi:predicted histone-like DNA-binding protein